jgi:hypothetical protein
MTRSKSIIKIGILGAFLFGAICAGEADPARAEEAWNMHAQWMGIAPDANLMVADSCYSPTSGPDNVNCVVFPNHVVVSELNIGSVTIKPPSGEILFQVILQTPTTRSILFSVERGTLTGWDSVPPVTIPNLSFDAPAGSYVYFLVSGFNLGGPKAVIRELGRAGNFEANATIFTRTPKEP